MFGEESKHSIVISRSCLFPLTVQCNHSVPLNINIIFVIAVSVILLIIHKLNLIFFWDLNHNYCNYFTFLPKMINTFLIVPISRIFISFRHYKITSEVLSDIRNDINSSGKFYYLTSLDCTLSKKLLILYSPIYNTSPEPNSYLYIFIIIFCFYHCFTHHNFGYLDMNHMSSNNIDLWSMCQKCIIFTFAIIIIHNYHSIITIARYITVDIVGRVITWIFWWRVEEINHYCTISFR